jgi:hypothetical protein
VGETGDTILHEELGQLERILSGWNLDFSKSIRGWVGQGKRLSDKQRTKAMEIIAKNRRYLLRKA